MATAGAPVIDDVFGVIVHPVRRQLLERLATGEHRVTDLAGPLPVSRSAVSQHLRLMLRLGVVAERRDGRERYYRLERDGLTGSIVSLRTWTPTHDRGQPRHPRGPVPASARTRMASTHGSGRARGVVD